MYLVTPKQMKEIEDYSDKHGVSYLTLMQNAGEQLASEIHTMPVDLSYGTVFFCGSGNNGGDGFVAARLLAQSDYPVTVVLMCGDPTTELATRMYSELEGSGAEVLNLYDNNDKIFSRLSSAALIVDAVFGTGFHGELPPQVKACFTFAARSTAKKLAVDVPSGGNCLSGSAADGTMKCDCTVTFANKKIGEELYPLCEYCGKIIVSDIGIDKACYSAMTRPIFETDADYADKMLPVRSVLSHKGTYGKLVNIAGSRKMPGAAALSTLAALRCGAGLVTLATAKSVADSLSSTIYEATYLPLKENDGGGISQTNEKEILAACEKSTAVSIGCGLGVSDDGLVLIKSLLKNLSCPVIIDADGLNCIGTGIDIFKDIKASVIITPHPAELGRLLGISTESAVNQRFELAQKLSAEYGITVLAKGVPTVISGSNGFSFVNRTGNAGLARGGSGDVLTGIIASLAAQGLEPTNAAAVGAYIFGAAADLVAKRTSMQGMLPHDVIDELPLLFKELNR